MGVGVETFQKKHIAVLVTMLSLFSSAQARFSGTSGFAASTLGTVHSTVFDACRAELLAVEGAGGQVIGASRVDASNPESAFESYSCNVKLPNGDLSPTYGGVGRTYVCPPNSSVESVRSDGLMLHGAVACSCNSFYEERYGRCVDPLVATDAISADKNAGGGSGCSLEGNPVNPATGGKFLSEDDYLVLSEGLPLAFNRTYNSSSLLMVAPSMFLSGLQTAPRRGVLGNGWRHNYERSLEFDNSNVQEGVFGIGSVIRVIRPQGGAVSFTKTSNGFTGEPDSAHVLSVAGVGQAAVYSFFDADTNQTEFFDFSGRLIQISALGGWKQTFQYSNISTPANRAPAVGLLLTVIDLSGRRLELYYDAESRLTKLVDPSGKTIAYSYDDLGNLSKVTYQDLSERGYRYGEAENIDAIQDDNGNLIPPDLPYVLTGIVDEDGQRYATYRYRSDGKAISTEHAGGAQRYQFSYNSDGTVSITQPLGGVRVRSYAIKQGNKLPAGVDKSCAAEGGGSIDFAKVTYDGVGNAVERQDFRGYRNSYAYNTRNLEVTRLEGLSSGGATLPETRKFTTEWDSQWSKPTKVAEPLRLKTYVYDATGNLKTYAEQATTDSSGAQAFSAPLVGTARVWSMTYESGGQLKTVDGPRTDIADITTHTYYSLTDTDLGKRGNLASTKNALGQEVQFTSYNAHGQPTTIVDANGVATSLQYDDRQRLKQATVGGETTTFDYYSTGLLKRVTLPDASYIENNYDAAHRLIGVRDNFGNYQSFVLDSAGNKTQETVRNNDGNLVRQIKRVYNAYSRLEKDVGSNNDVRASYGYDLQGNVSSVTSPFGAGTRVVSNTYDALGRISVVTDQGLQTVKLLYDALNQVVSYTDPRLLVTTYSIDGLGNQTQLNSPDAGNTLSHFDGAGNEIDRSDAKGQKLVFSYDALNRLIKVSYPDGASDNYVWDQGNNGKGRLTRIEKIDSGNNVQFAEDRGYDALGRMVSDVRFINGITYTTQYRYSNGRLAGITYPSGKKIDYTLNALGQVTDVKLTVGTLVTSLASSIVYHPFGGVKQLTNGAGQVLTWGEDSDGRPNSYVLDGKTWQVAYDNASRISIQQNLTDSSQVANFSYDGSDRLLKAILPSVTYGYTYDNVGNRLTQNNGSLNKTYTLGASSNRLLGITGSPSRSFTYDANGSVEQDGVATYVYDSRGRRKSAIVGGATTNYLIDPMGFRARKSGLEDVVFTYDLSGRLLSESDPTGVIRKEYIWVANQLLAIVQ